MSMNVGKGETLVLIGPNGAGKSTLEKTIVGLYAPTSGSVRVFGKNPASDAATRSKIGFVGENYALYDTMTAMANLVFFSKLYGISTDEAKERAGALLAEFGASEFAHRKIGELSRGTRQKIAVCRALMTEPKVLVLDEPTAFLDPGSAEVLREKLIGMKSTTVVYATQRLDELGRISGSVGLLNRGMLVAKGSLEEIMKMIKGIEIEVVLARKPGADKLAMLKTMGAKATGRRLLFSVSNLAELPELTRTIASMDLSVLTISYLNYELGKSEGRDGARQ
ncbi:MAG: ABC transporter ATP-binding protein [Candidatus Micrarchaeia archaeon]